MSRPLPGRRSARCRSPALASTSCWSGTNPTDHWRAAGVSGSGSAVDFELTQRQAHFRDRVRAFVDEHIRPRTGEYQRQHHEGERWQPITLIDELKPKAREAALW